QQKEKSVVSRKAIVKQVQKYIKQKEKDDPASKWGLVLFEHGADNPTFLDALAEDETEFEKFLQDNLKSASKDYPLEQGLMLASTYLVEAFRTTKDHVYRMVVISDGPSGDSNLDLTKALLDMLDTIKYFPVYIDIIRYGEQRVYSDDVKLKFITDATGGGIFYADSENTFKRILEEQFPGLDRPLDFHRAIPAKLLNYYEGLCYNLQQSNSPSFTCPACKSGPNSTLGAPVACEKCSTIYHERCVEELPNRYTIGLPGVTRCVHCAALLSPSLVKSAPLVLPSQIPRDVIRIDDAPTVNRVAPKISPSALDNDGIELVESPSPDLVKPGVITIEKEKPPVVAPASMDDPSPRFKFTPQRVPIG
nr:hypothetical protein [Candidatus Sigynarchaeota archaeon]